MLKMMRHSSALFRCTIPSIVISLRFNKRGYESNFEFEEQLEKEGLV